MSRFVILETDEATLEGEIHNDNMFLHIEYNNKAPFTASLYKKFLRLWAKVVKALKDKGVVEVFSFVTTDSDKINKWQKMFGMQPLLETSSHILYRRVL